MTPDEIQTMINKAYFEGWEAVFDPIWDYFWAFTVAKSIGPYFDPPNIHEVACGACGRPISEHPKRPDGSCIEFETECPFVDNTARTNADDNNAGY